MAYRDLQQLWYVLFEKFQIVEVQVMTCIDTYAYIVTVDSGRFEISDGCCTVYMIVMRIRPGLEFYPICAGLFSAVYQHIDGVDE